MRTGSAVDLAAEFGGTFVSPESGARGDNVMASTAYIPEIAEEEERVTGRDPLRGRKFSSRFGRSPFSQLEHAVNGDGEVTRRYRAVRNLSHWPLNGGTVNLEELGSVEMDLEISDDEVDDEGFPEACAFDPFVGPRFIDPESLSRQPLYDLLRLGGPAYVVRVYEMAGEKGRFDLLNRLPSIVARLQNEGVYSLGLFKQTKVEVDGRSFSAVAILRGYAAEELRVIGSEGGIACRILEILGSPIRRIA